MSTTAEAFRLADDIFRGAVRLDRSHREQYIHDRCAGDERLVAHVLALLRADDVPSGVLDQPLLGDSIAVRVLDTAASGARPLPSRVGRYRIVAVIGEGGMGVVYEAEQEQPIRRVALKVIRPGAHTATMLRRFRREAQLLGRLKHPGIAQIYEAGTDEQNSISQPYFAMELVKGRPLFEHARVLGLDTRERLELIARACDAVHHAHLNGIIHRYLKPANILVVRDAATTDARGMSDPGQPKILDFGIARALEADLSMQTVQTESGQLIGTVAYMSPEQATVDPAHIDFRSDVYALGVIAYELISGHMPYRVRDGMLHKALRIIREADPSRLSLITRSFRGDIETIIAKALEKDPARRYQSAAEFASDIRRFLHEQPISARPASQLYQLRKFARRNRTLVTGVAVAFGALLAGTTIALQQAASARTAAVEARRQTYRATLAAASSALRFHEVDDAARQLDVAPPELRGWEWSQFCSRLDDSLHVLNTGFTPMCMAISPDGRKVASCNSGGKIVVWSVPDFVELRQHELTGSVPRRRVVKMVFSADGQVLRADSHSGATWLDVETMTLIARDDIAAGERSIDGRWGFLVNRGGQGRVRLIEIATKREVLNLPSPPQAKVLGAFSEDGEKLLVSAPDEIGASMYLTRTGECLWSRPDLADAMHISFSPDGAMAGVAQSSGVATIIDTSTGRDLLQLRGHSGSVTRIAFSSDGELAATSSSDRAMRLWRTSDGALLSAMHGGSGTVQDIAFAPPSSASERCFVTLGSDRCARWWDAASESTPFVLNAPSTAYGVAFSPDGMRLAGACLMGDRPLRIWDVASHRRIYAGSEGHLSAIAFDPQGTHIAVGRSGTSPTSVIDLLSPSESSFAGHWWRTNWLSLDHANELWSMGNGGRLVSHDLASGAVLRKKIFLEQDTGEGCRAAIAPDRSVIAVASGSTIHLLDYATWDELARLSVPSGAIYALCFSPDSRLLVSGGVDRTLRVWNLRQRRVIASMSAHTDEIYAAVFSPDGRRLVSAGRDRLIRVWSADRFEPLAVLYGHTSLVYCLAFSPDGRVLASGGGDATVRLWETRAYRDCWEARRAGTPDGMNSFRDAPP